MFSSRNNNRVILAAAVVVLVFAAISYSLYDYNHQMITESTKLLFGQVNNDVNVSELNTLDRMRYTTIQMTILDLQNTNEPTNLTNDEITNKIFEYQQSNNSIDRLTTLEIENLYRNITNGT
jgi:hypothetical protein